MSDVIAQQRAPRRAKQILNRLLQDKDITPEGIRWLFLALDPFHDTDIDAVGLPDGQNTRSLVRCLRKTVQVTKPAGLASGALWDMRVDITPLLQAWNTTTGNGRLQPAVTATGQVPVSNAGTTRVNSGVTIGTFPTGDNYLTSASAVSVNDLELSSTDDPRRIVGIGFEVVNTTPELYKGGTVHVYRFPTSVDRKSVYYTLAGALSQAAKIATGLPVLLSDIDKDPRTRTYSAIDGAYVTGTLFDVENTPFETYSPGSVALMQWGNNQANTLCLHRNTLGADPSINDNRLQNINFSGAWFNGLHEQSSFAVTAKYFYEDLVPIGDEMYNLTRATPVRDNLALEIYSRALAELPVGCPVSENPLGEWFNDVMNSIADYAPLLGNLVPGIGGLIGNGVGHLAKTAGAINQHLADKERERKDKQRVAAASAAPNVKAISAPPVRPAPAAKKTAAKTAKRNK